MPEITVAPAGDGQIAFAVSWAEPMRAEFGSRLEAERFAAWLRTTGLTIEPDGSCAPCNAHHAAGHDCPSCDADLSLRISHPTGKRRPRPLIVPDRFIVAREQAKIREEVAAGALARRLADVEAASIGAVTM